MPRPLSTYSNDEIKVELMKRLAVAGFSGNCIAEYATWLTGEPHNRQQVYYHLYRHGYRLTEIRDGRSEEAQARLMKEIRPFLRSRQRRSLRLVG